MSEGFLKKPPIRCIAGSRGQFMFGRKLQDTP